MAVDPDDAVILFFDHVAAAIRAECPDEVIVVRSAHVKLRVAIDFRHPVHDYAGDLHPDADVNFPTSWTSHFIPSREHNPLVYYINIFYMLIIPGTIGFMITYVLLDAMNRFGFRPYRRIRRRGKKWGEEK